MMNELCVYPVFELSWSEKPDSSARLRAVMDVAETRYVKTADGVHLAYQVVGEGPRDIMFLSSWDLAIDFHWDQPDQVRFFELLERCGRVILFDKRGTGASDSVSLDRMPTLESWTDDIRVVMDEVGAAQAAIVAGTYTGPLGVLFAATYPTRTSSLVLIDTFARFRHRLGDPVGVGFTDEEIRAGQAMLERHWGAFTDDMFAAYAPSLAGNERLRAWWNRCERLSISPAAAVAFSSMMWNSDVGDILPLVQAPTLVLYRRGGNLRLSSHHLAQGIADATLIAVDGIDALPWIGDSVAEEIALFLTGVRAAPDSSRVLSSIVFTDLVESTAQASAIGDRRWRSVLDGYEAIVEHHLNVFHGHLVKSTGDGTLATFDGPARAVRFACSMRDAARELSLELRCGVHTGEIELRGDDISGVAVHIAARVLAMAAPGEVLVSRTVVDLVAGSGIAFDDRGERELKGVQGRWRLFATHD